MSEGENHHHGKNEIIIVKRHKGGHDGAHGGAWKIAFADFMTAMMAFFLVMWLVNASNEKTTASVASYFNPIKLTDEQPAERGLKQPAKKEQGEENSAKSDTKTTKSTEGSAAASGEDSTTTSGQNVNFSETAFFENPYAVLAEIAQEVGQQANVSAKGEGGASVSGPATGADGGEAYRDPFDPDFWTKQVEVTRADGQKTAQAQVPPVEEASATPQEMLPPMSPAPVDPAATKIAASSGQETAGKPDATEVAVAVPQPRPDAASIKADTAAVAAQQKAADDLKAEIEKQISGIPGKLAEGLIVTPTEGGMLITVTDQSQTPMFNLGSAVPRKELVMTMEKIGAILKDRPGNIVIRGHTDARQFKGVANDNWRLSAARAHSAYFMLVKGGLTETRVSQISGYADRRLQVPDQPLADQNRRIEILLEDNKI